MRKYAYRLKSIEKRLLPTHEETPVVIIDDIGNEEAYCFIQEHQDIADPIIEENYFKPNTPVVSLNSEDILFIADEVKKKLK